MHWDLGFLRDEVSRSEDGHAAARATYFRNP